MAHPIYEMHPLMRKRPLLLLAVIASCLLGPCVVYLATRGHSPSSQPVSSVVTPKTSSHLARQILAAKKSAIKSGVQSSDNAPIPGVSACIQDVFPTLAAPITNWRTYEPTEMTIKAAPEMPAVVFLRARVTKDDTSTTWVGMHSNPTVNLVGVGTSQGWDAVVSLGAAGQYEIHVRGDAVEVTKPAPGVCGTDDIGARLQNKQQSVEKDIERTLDFSFDGSSLSLAQTVEAASTDSLPIVDVLFFYDCVTETEAGYVGGRRTDPATLIASTMKARIAASNLALERSHVNFRWNYVSAIKIPDYTPTGDMEVDFWLLSNPAGATGPDGINKREEAACAFITAEFEKAGADQWVSIGNDLAFYINGVAERPGHMAMVGWKTDYLTLAHELAHNFGCRHDRATAQIPDTNTDYNFGYVISMTGGGNPLYFQSGQTIEVGTIMSYSERRTPFFSSPELRIKGTDLLPFQDNNPVLITDEVFALGIPEGQARAADNVRWLNAQCGAMAAYHTAPATTILAQPAKDVVGAVGQSATLSVTATGSVSSYQWRRNGIAILGATSATLELKNLTAGDAGDYDCIVTWDSTKSATSTTSRVTVRSPAPPVIAAPPPAFALAKVNERFELDCTATEYAAYVWQKDGHNCDVLGSTAAFAYTIGWDAPLADATTSTYVVPIATSAVAGTYTVKAVNESGFKESPAIIVGVSTTEKFVGQGQLVGENVRHPNGHTMDQILVTGFDFPRATAVTVSADPGQMTRASYIDRNDDIVQVEFSGAGTLSLVLGSPFSAATPANYSQPGVAYSNDKGRAGIVIVGANETTNVSVFTVGRATAFDPSGSYDMLTPISATNDPANNKNPIFDGRASTSYDGFADIAYIAIASSNGRFGGIRAANTRFGVIAGLGTTSNGGFVGVYAPNVAFDGPVYVGDLMAADDAVPCLLLGSCADVRITGGSLIQVNAKPLRISGIQEIKFTEGSDSHGRILPTQKNRCRFEENGVDVTAKVVKYTSTPVAGYRNISLKWELPNVGQSVKIRGLHFRDGATRIPAGDYFLGSVSATGGTLPGHSASNAFNSTDPNTYWGYPSTVKTASLRIDSGAGKRAEVSGFELILVEGVTGLKITILGSDDDNADAIPLGQVTIDLPQGGAYAHDFF